MIQILGLRKFIPKDSKDGKEITYDAFHEKYWRAKSVPDLFHNLDGVLQKIPEQDRWNLFYTLANCKEGKREFDSLSVIAFDIDGINKKYLESYIEVILSRLKLSRSEVGIVSSGHGLHFLIGIKTPITSKEEFKSLKPHYKAVCTQINKAMFDAGLIGSTDTTIFEPRRILRLPRTINRKPSKVDVLSELMQSNITPLEFNLKTISGLPDISETAQLNIRVLAKYPRVDSTAIMDGCDFLKHCKTRPNEISEHQWYAALSITGRMNDESTKDGYEWSHELSKGYKGYDPDETDQKIEQALESSGPRTCDNINSMWTGCGQCDNKDKVSSPILLRGKDAIPTEHTGFHNQPFTGKGKPTPNYEDLARFFARDTTYKGLDDSGMVHIWSKDHYESMGRLRLEEFAQTHFNPAARSNMTKEFAARVARSNLKTMDWWTERTKGKINFKNGYLDVRSHNFMPHDPDMGFRYVLPYSYDPTAKAPSFEKMLGMITENDQARINVLLEFMGYALSNDDCWTQKALLLVGDGANGKSTLLDILRELAGYGNYTSYAMKQLNESEYNRQGLDGKLFNISEETPTKAMADNSLFKSLATGDEVQARAPYKEPYFFKSLAKLIFSANELPGSTDTSYGYWRRLIVVPFNATFTKDMPGYDPHIGLKLKKELSGIFNLVMAGYQRLIKQQKFSTSAQIDDALEDYRLDNDTVFRWFGENMTVHTNGGYDENFTPMRTMYDNYKFEVQSDGGYPVTMQKFAKTLRKLVPGYERRYKRPVVNQKRVRGLQGVSIQTFG